MTRDAWLAALKCLLAAALFGLAPAACKTLLATVPPVFLAGLLYTGAALAAFPFAVRGGFQDRRLRRGQRARLGAAVVLGGCVAPVLLLLGLKSAPASSVSLLLNLETAATAVLAWLFFREHMNRRRWIAVASVSLGGLLLATPSEFSFAPAAALVALASACWGLENNLTSVIDAYTPSQMTLVKGVVAGATSLLLGVLRERPTLTVQGVIAALLVGAFAYGFSIVLHVAGSQRLGATKAQLIFSTSPFIALVVSWIFLREPIEGVQILAAGAMIGGLVVLFRAGHSHDHAHEPQEHMHEHNHDDGHHEHVHGEEDSRENHTHVHEHAALSHAHEHDPDLHHRHGHE